MNVGDNAQLGEVDAQAAGRDFTSIHNDLLEVGKLLQLFTDSLEAQRAADRRERVERQRELDMHTAGFRSAIDALRTEQAALRTDIADVRWRTRYTPHLIVGVVVLGAAWIIGLVLIIWLLVDRYAVETILRLASGAVAAAAVWKAFTK